MLPGLINSIPIPALVIGQDELIIAANSKVAGLLGPSLVGRNYITALRQPSVLDAIEGCMREGQDRQSRYLGRDGARETSYLINCSQITAQGNTHVLVCFEDITHVEEAGQMRRDFVANVSHELRTPLTSLMGFIETLRGPARNDPEATDRFLGIMQGETARMERLVKELLTLSRVEDQERVRPTQKVDICATLRSVMHSLRPLADEKNVQIDMQLPEAALMVTGDADQLVQVFTNLVENAIKYGGSGKPVSVIARFNAHASSVRGAAVVVQVIDQGPGIEPYHLPRLTERFYRVDNHRSRDMGGTGLGLAIVKHIVNRHRGRLKMDSDLGKGSEFKVILPTDFKPE